MGTTVTPGKGILALIIAAASLLGSYRVVWQEYQCNLTLSRIKSVMEHQDNGSDFRTMIMAHRNLELLIQDCAKCRTQRVDYLLMKGNNEVLLHQYTGALATYRQALQFDRRPEIYLNIGLTELDQGNYAGGLDNLITACAFNFAMNTDLPEPAKTDVATRVNSDRQQVIDNLKRNRH
jgi:tetratricopeptide (TPR) repeat protein